MDGEAARVGAVIFAAGGGLRMGGRVKALLPWGAETLVQRAIRTAQGGGADVVVVVAGHGATAVRAALGSADVQVVENKDWLMGMSMSMQAGLAALDETVGAVVFLLVDQPTVAAAQVADVIATWRERGAALVSARYRGGRGHPVLVGRELWPDLMAVRGDEGARGLFRRADVAVAWVEVDADAPRDIDTLGDYSALAGAVETE